MQARNTSDNNRSNALVNQIRCSDASNSSVALWLCFSGEDQMDSGTKNAQRSSDPPGSKIFGCLRDLKV